MILRYKGKLPIGKIITGKNIQWHGNVYTNQPFVILREATKQEYIDECLADNGTPDPMYPDDSYYDIHID